MKHTHLNVEFKRQSARYLRRIRELAFGGFAAGVLLLIYSHTTLPSAGTAEGLTEKLANEIALPDWGFLLFAIGSCCITLVFTGWPPAKVFRHMFAIPYLKFCFDLTGTAIGVLIPAVIATSTKAQFFGGSMLIVYALVYLLLVSVVLWGGQYALSERVQSKLQSGQGPIPYVLPLGATIILVSMYLTSRAI